MTTDAPIIPVVAAMIVPMSVTDSARPPGTRRSSPCRQLRRSRATPGAFEHRPHQDKHGDRRENQIFGKDTEDTGRG